VATCTFSIAIVPSINLIPVEAGGIPMDLPYEQNLDTRHQDSTAMHWTNCWSTGLDIDS
jgi:hypothetical protein